MHSTDPLAPVIRGLAYIAGATLLCIMVLTMLDVAIRVLHGRGFPGTVEYAEILIVVAVYCALPFTQWQGGHVSMSLVTDRLKGKTYSAVTALSYSVSALLLMWLAWETSHHGWAAYVAGEARHGIIRVPIWPVKLLIPIALALTVYVAIRQALSAARGKDLHNPSLSEGV